MAGGMQVLSVKLIVKDTKPHIGLYGVTDEDIAGVEVATAGQGALKLNVMFMLDIELLFTIMFWPNACCPATNNNARTSSLRAFINDSWFGFK